MMRAEDDEEIAINGKYLQTNLPLPESSLIAHVDDHDVKQRVTYLGFSFCLLFTGFHACQDFITTLLPHSAGFTVLCLIYVSFAFGSLIAPAALPMVERRVGQGRGEIMTMSVSALTFVLFILSLTTGQLTLVFAAAIMKGLSSGMLWIGQGLWLRRLLCAYRLRLPSCTDWKRGQALVGRATGTFFALFNLNGIFGSLLVIVLVKAAGTGVTGMLLGMAAVSLVGALLIGCSASLPESVSSEEVQDVALNPTEGGKSEMPQDIQSDLEQGNVVGFLHRLRQLVKNMLDLCKLQPILYLTPYLFCQGMSMAYTYGNYPTLITFVSSDSTVHTNTTTSTTLLTTINTPMNQRLDPMEALPIAYAFLVYGLGSMLSSYGWGLIYDRYASRLTPLLYAHLVLGLAGYLLLFHALSQTPDTSLRLPMMYSVGALFGITDSLVNAIINNSMAHVGDEKQAPSLFSWYRFCYCMGFAGASLASSMLPSVSASGLSDVSGNGVQGWRVMALLNLITIALSVGLGFRLSRLVASSPGQTGLTLMH